MYSFTFHRNNQLVLRGKSRSGVAVRALRTSTPITAHLELEPFEVRENLLISVGPRRTLRVGRGATVEITELGHEVMVTIRDIRPIPLRIRTAWRVRSDIRLAIGYNRMLQQILSEGDVQANDK